MWFYPFSALLVSIHITLSYLEKFSLMIFWSSGLLYRYRFFSLISVLIQSWYFHAVPHFLYIPSPPSYSLLTLSRSFNLNLSTVTLFSLDLFYLYGFPFSFLVGLLLFFPFLFQLQFVLCFYFQIELHFHILGSFIIIISLIFLFPWVTLRCSFLELFI